MGRPGKRYGYRTMILTIATAHNAVPATMMLAKNVLRKVVVQLDHF